MESETKVRKVKFDYSMDYEITKEKHENNVVEEKGTV
jgi:hypothetical protein